MTILQRTLLFFLPFFFIVFFLSLSLQSPCISDVKAESSAMIPSPEDFGSVPCLNKKLSIVAYIVLDSLGQPNITYQQILDEIDSVNKDFSPICLSFELCDTVYIENFQYDKLDTMPNLDTVDEAKTIMDLYYRPNVINMYFVTDLTGFNPGDPKECGITYGPPSAQSTDTLDFVVIKKSCIPSKAMSHLLGHFFGLWHTFQVPGEFVNGSNCTVKGDSLCDTEADPNGTVDPSCKLVSPLKDSNGDFYLPPVDNIMSYYEDCRCRFTRQQYFRMAQQYLATRTYLW